MVPVCSGAQQNFNYSDSTFSAGQIKRIDIVYDLSGGRPQISTQSKQTFDSVFSFLDTKKNICIEIGVHLLGFGDTGYFNNKYRSEKWAFCIYEELLIRGIDIKRISFNGYGNDQPVIVNNQIHDKYPFLKIGQVLDEVFFHNIDSNEQRQIVFNLCLRTELKIVKINQP